MSTVGRFHQIGQKRPNCPGFDPGHTKMPATRLIADKPDTGHSAMATTVGKKQLTTHRRVPGTCDHLQRMKERSQQVLKHVLHTVTVYNLSECFARLA